MNSVVKLAAKKQPHQTTTTEEEQLRIFIDQSPYAIAMFDRNMIYLAASQRWISDSVQGDPKIIGRSHYEVLPNIPDRWRIVHQHSLQGAIEKSEDDAFRKADGTIVHLRWETRPWRDYQGNIGGIIIFSEDITEYKNTERKLQKALIQEQADRIKVEKLKTRADYLANASRILASSLDFFATFQQVANLAVPILADWCMVFDGELKPMAVASANPKLLAMIWELQNHYPVKPSDTSTAAEALRTQKSVLRVNVDDARLVEFAKSSAHLKILRDLGLQSSLAVPLLVREHSCGVLMLFSTTPGRKFDQGDLDLAEELSRRASVAIDNATLYSEAQKSVQLRDDFISIASHELKTPLTALKMQLQLIPKVLGRITFFGKDNLFKLIGKSLRQLDQFSRLVDELLDISKISGGRLVLTIQNVVLSEVILQTLDQYQSELRNSGYTVTTNLDPTIQGHWDPTRIEQIIVNLLTNAIKYGAGKPIEITTVRSGHKARLCVQDHGIGLAQEDQKKIFERFERAAPVSKYRGLGLGLYITRQIIEAHGGTIHVESTLGQGSTFIVELPLHHSPQ